VTAGVGAGSVAGDAEAGIWGARTSMAAEQSERGSSDTPGVLANSAGVCQ
jgi:hypothetical protein